jgi:hypothetical protein
MADRLSIYQGALRLLGPSRLASLTEDRPERHALDAAWEDAVNYLLEQALWNFGIRTIEITSVGDVEPIFGYGYAFPKPDDWIRTAGISSTGAFSRDEPFNDFEDQAGFWFANLETMYVQYLSNDQDYGWNIGEWRQNFSKTLEAYLAFECGLPVSADRGNRNDLHSLFKDRLARAKNLDAVDERVRRKPSGCLVRTRYGSIGRRNNG